MPAQVPRGNIYQDGEIGGVQDPAHSPLGERAEGRQGRVDQLEETGDFSLSAGQKGLSFHRTALHVVLTLSG